MRALSTSIGLALLCGDNVSLSFLTSPPRLAGSATAATVESSSPLPRRPSPNFSTTATTTTAMSTMKILTARAIFNQVSSTVRGGSREDKDFGTLNSLSVSELKCLLDDRGADYRDCIEERDLVERLIDSRGSSSSYSFGHADGAGGLSQEENRVVNTFTRASPSVAYIQTIQQQTIQRGFSLKGTDVPTGAGSGFLWDNKVSSISYRSHRSVYQVVRIIKPGTIHCRVTL